MPSLWEDDDVIDPPGELACPAAPTSSAGAWPSAVGGRPSRTWELTPFYCPDCDLNYCRADWETFPIFDEGFCDCTIGICPSGHRHTVDD